MFKKWLIITLSVVLALLTAAGGGGYWYFQQALAVTSGALLVGVKEAVRIERDAYGIPHLYAENEHDLMYAQGYVQVQDRLLQMEMARRAVSGRLAEVVGEAMVGSDRFYRTIGFKRAAEAGVDKLPSDSKQNLQAFVDGVNAAIEDLRREDTFPAEFIALGIEIEPWTIADTLSVGKLMAWDLGGNMRTELLMSLLVPQLGEEKARALLPLAGNLDGLNDEHSVAAITAEDAAELIDVFTAARDVGIPGEGLGSNNWVVSGSRSVSGKPMLGSDMHLGLSAPSVFYQHHLVVPGMYNVSGVTFPGVPGVVVGHNDRISWAFTNGMGDVQDLYIEKQNPDNPHQFEYNGEWENATVIQEEIRVKGQEEPVRYETVITRHGPILNSLFEELQDGERPTAGNVLKTAAPITKPLALRWVAHDPSDEIGAVMQMNKAGNWQEFEQAMRRFHAPVQNVIYADVEGNIGYRYNGLIPIRKKGNGLQPVPGWTDEYEWQGYIPWEELPQSYNPPSGFIATANNRIADTEYKHFLSHEWEPNYRVSRITEMIEEQDKLNLADFQQMQTDWKDLQAVKNLSIMLPILQKADLSETEQEALAILQEWASNGIDSPDAVGPTIYHSTFVQMIEKAFLPQMGEKLYINFMRTGLPNNALDAIIQSNLPAWFTGTNQTKDALIVEGFQAAVAGLVDQLGKKPEKWTWGSVHTLTLRHPLAANALLGKLFNEGPHPYGGSNNTVGMGSFSRLKPFQMGIGAPWRFTIDMGNPNAAEDIMIMGVSAQLGSDHYTDQTALWLEGRYKKMPFAEQDVSEQSKTTLLLQPSGTL